MDGPFTIYPPKKLIFATNRPDDESLASDVSYLGVWSYEKSSEGPTVVDHRRTKWHFPDAAWRHAGCKK